MRAFLTTLATCSAAMSAVAIMLMLLDALALRRRKIPARAMRMAWLVVTVGFILPMRPDLRRLAALLPHAEPAIDALHGQLLDVMPMLATIPAATVAPLPTTPPINVPAAVRTPTAPHWQPDWVLIVTLVYIAGATLVLGFELWRHWRFRRTVLRWSHPADAALNALSNARIVVSRAVQAPLLMGVRQPVIVLPERAMPLGDLHAMIAHEECHRANHDVLIQYVALLARALHWFNPLMLLIASELTLKCEQLCDEMTLTNCAITRRTYVGTILAAAATRRAPLTTGFAGGKHIMKRRLTALYSRSVPRARALILALALALTVFAPSLMALAAQADPTASADAPTATDSQPQPTSAVLSDGPTASADAPTIADSQPQQTSAMLNDGLTASDMLQNVLTITLAACEGDYETNALQLLAAGSGVDALVNALNMYDRLEALYLGEGFSFDQLTEQYPELANRAMYDLVTGASEPKLAERAQLMLAAGELLPEVYVRLGIDGYDESDATASELLDDALAIMWAYFGGDDITSAMLILSAGDGVDALLNALDMYNSMETVYIDEGLSFEELAEQHTELANQAMYDLVISAPEPKLAVRAQLMFASGELFPEIYAQLAQGKYDARSALCACLAYNLAQYSGRISQMLSSPDAAMRVEADTALTEWWAATGRGDLFGISAPEPDTEATATETPVAVERTLSGGDSPAEVLSDMMTITLTRPGIDALTAANMILAVGDGVGEAMNALDTYDLLETAYRDEGLTFDEITDKYLSEYVSIGNEAMFALMASAPKTDISTQAKLMFSSGELFPEIYAQLKLGQYDAPSLLSACIAYNVAAYKGRVTNVCIVDAAERAKAMNALVEWSAAISTDDNNMLLNIFGPMNAERAEIEAQLEAEQRDDIQLLPIYGTDEQA